MKRKEIRKLQSTKDHMKREISQMILKVRNQLNGLDNGEKLETALGKIFTKE